MVYLICGQKGTGKTLFTISFLMKHKKRYEHIFSNFPVKFCEKVDHIEWVKYKFPKNSAILIDEAQLYFNSREFAKLTKNGVGMELLDYLTMCRHYDVDIFFITQSSNRIDLQIRELSDYVFYLKKTFKIPFINRPFLTYGLQFIDIMEFEKYMNPNNFQSEFKCSFLIKFITTKNLKQFDTHHIEKSYLLKRDIPQIAWSTGVTSGVTPSRIGIINLFILKVKYIFYKLKKYISLRFYIFKNKET